MNRTNFITISICVISALFLFSHKIIAQPVVGMYDELSEIYPDSKNNNPVSFFSVDAARGTLASVHLLLTNLNHNKTVQFSIKDINGNQVIGAKWYRMIDVPVLENTGLDRATEKFSKKTNPFVMRKAPFNIYEALAPVTSPINVDSTTMALRIEIPFDSMTKAGKYDYKITLKLDNEERKLDFSVNVHKAIVPSFSKSTLYYVNWMNLTNLCKYHNVEKFSEPFWLMLKKYAELMAKGRQNTFWFIWGDFFTYDEEGNITKFESDNLERYIRTFLSEGFHTIQGAPFLRRRNWETDGMLVSIPGSNEISAVSEKGKKLIVEMMNEVIKLMKKNGWENKWVQGIFDEPTDEYVGRYKEIVSLTRSIKPDLKILEATMTTSLSGIVNYWCPQVQEYQANRKFFEERKTAGDKVLVYTCLAPGGPWINRLVDQERLRQVYVGWACSKFDLDGFLHWGLNFQRGNPLKVLVTQHGDSTNFLPAGDSHIIYALAEGPISGQRFEAHRIGMEDFELLQQLKLKDPAKAQEIIGIVFQAFDNYSKDIAIYRSAKNKLLEVLDKSLTE